MNRVGLLAFLFFTLIAANCSAQASPKPRPPGALGDVDTAFLAEYMEKSNLLAGSNLPFVEVVGSSLYLHKGSGEIQQKEVLSTIFHALKDVTHVPFTVYLRLSSLQKTSLSDDGIGRLKILVAQIAAAEDALQSGGFSDIQMPRQRQILDASRTILQDVIAVKKVDQAALQDFARTMSPLMLQNADEAGCYQVQATHTQMMTWKKTLSSEEWSRLIAVNKGVHQARYLSAATQYFAWLLQGSSPKWAYPGEGSRVVYAEYLPPNQKGIDELAAVLIDADASRAFFGDEWRMTEDILSKGAAGCISQLPEADRTWHPH